MAELRSRLVLASASPQRRAILDQLGVVFEVRPVEVEEETSGEPVAVAGANARRKAQAAAAVHQPVSADAEVEAEAILAADTVVALEGRILPKPRGEFEAREWLDVLNGATHRVVTALALARGGELAEAHETTDVTFRTLSRGERDWYLATGEWRDRAGGYAIQGRGAALVARISGDYTNVVGLPVPALLSLLPDVLRGRAGAGGPRKTASG